jgi:hypothetical protein
MMLQFVSWVLNIPVVSPRLLRSSETFAARRATELRFSSRAWAESWHRDKDLVAAACWALRFTISAFMASAVSPGWARARGRVAITAMRALKATILSVEVMKLRTKSEKRQKMGKADPRIRGEKQFSDQPSKHIILFVLRHP